MSAGFLSFTRGQVGKLDHAEARFGTDPQAVVPAVVLQRGDGVARQPDVADGKTHEVMSVETVQASFGADPYLAALVLHHGGDVIVAKAVLDVQVLHGRRHGAKRPGGRQRPLQSKS